MSNLISIVGRYTSSPNIPELQEVTGNSDDPNLGANFIQVMAASFHSKPAVGGLGGNDPIVMESSYGNVSLSKGAEQTTLQWERAYLAACRAVLGVS